MLLSPAAINQYIRSRRMTTPDFFSGEKVSKEIIEAILENANWAPTHKMTQPWRFKIFYEKGLKKLADYLAEYYKQHTPAKEFSEMKFQKNKNKALQSACVIAIIMKRSSKIEIPEWEEIASVACAVENIWLSLAAYNLGGYWSTPEAMINGNKFLQLQDGERCLGIFYIGSVAPIKENRKRISLSEKISWITE